MMRQNHSIRCDGAGSDAVGVNVLIQDGRPLVLHNLVPPDFDAAATSQKTFHPMVWRAYLNALNGCEIVFVAFDARPILIVVLRCALSPMSRFSILAVFAGHPSQWNQLSVQLGVVSVAQLLGFGFQIAIDSAALNDGLEILDSNGMSGYSYFEEDA